MRLLIWLLVFCLLSITVFAAQPTLNWEESFNLEGATVSNERIFDIEFDRDGNIVATGSCTGCGPQGSSAIMVMKFSSLGVPIWDKVFDPSDSYDEGYGITVDLENNIYVAGRCTDCGENQTNSWYLIKLDSDGNTVWEKTYDYGAGNGARDIAFHVDGYLIVVGNAQNANVVKLDTEGNEIWVQEGFPTISSALPYGVHIDSASNILIAGTCFLCLAGTTQSAFVVSLDSDGNFNWIHNQTYESTMDSAFAITSRANRGIYVTGECRSCGTHQGRGMYTTKYDQNGDLQWSVVENLASSASAIEVDVDENVYIAGYCSACGSLGGSAFYSTKYDKDGNTLWDHTLDTSSGVDFGTSLLLDDNQNVFIGGTCHHCDGHSKTTYLYSLSQGIVGGTCFDGILNQNEEDIDCGGVCDACSSSGNATSDATCIDVILNGNETDIDCGGPDCDACALGLVCLLGSDCSTGVCTDGRCDISASLSNTTINFTENVVVKESEGEQEEEQVLENEVEQVNQKVIITEENIDAEFEKVIKEIEESFIRIEGLGGNTLDLKDDLLRASDQITVDNYAVLSNLRNVTFERESKVRTVTALYRDVYPDVEHAAQRGIHTPRSKKLLEESSRLFDQGEYDLAELKARQAIAVLQEELHSKPESLFARIRWELVFLVIVIGLLVYNFVRRSGR